MYPTTTITQHTLGLGLSVLTVSPLAAHVNSCFALENWGFLIAGVILTPVGIINGLGIWLGMW
jgi:hypothetical protein